MLRGFMVDLLRDVQETTGEEGLGWAMLASLLMGVLGAVGAVLAWRKGVKREGPEPSTHLHIEGDGNTVEFHG